MLTLRIRSITHEAEGILSYELVDVKGAMLPDFSAVAHLDVKVPGGMSRRYSLCGRPGISDRYQIAVLNVPQGRGGSKAMHERLRPGDLIEVSKPHNFFPLVDGAKHYLLLAGGIGITPLMAMLEQLEANQQSYHLHYCTTSPERTAFLARLSPFVAQGKVTIHHDGGVPGKGLDISRLLATPEEGTHLYYCGPAGFMQAIEQATQIWPKESVHFEHFGPVAAKRNSTAAGVDVSQGQEIKLSRSNQRVTVNPGETILSALRRAGVDVETSCESGVCGTCKMPYLEGSPEHNDYVLSDEERQTHVLVCCAKAGNGPLILDL